jgi:type IV fimbrial biogenesis protein FimT
MMAQYLNHYQVDKLSRWGKMGQKPTSSEAFMRKGKQRGVTLLELVIVMVIIALGAVALAPNIGAWLPGYRLRSASRDIVSTLRVAQMKAVSNNQEHRVLFNPGAGTYILQRNSGGWIADGASQPLPSGIQINSITFAGNNAQFNTNSSSSSGSITLRNSKGTTKRITLTPSTGRVRVE